MIVVMRSLLYTYLQMCQIVYIKYVQLFVCYISKTWLKILTDRVIKKEKGKEKPALAGVAQWIERQPAK